MSEARDVELAPEQLDLKVGSRALYRAYGGSDAAGEQLARRQQYVSDCGLPNTSRFFTIDEVAQLEDRTVGKAGHPHVTRAMAKRQGFELVRLPATVPSDAELMERFARLSKEFGDAAATIGAAIADGKVTAEEAGTGEREIDELLSEAVAVRALLARIRAEGGR